MSNQVVKCWNCPREFEVTLDRKPPVPVFRGFPQQDQTEPGKQRDREIARTCPFCGKDNIIIVAEES